MRARIDKAVDLTDGGYKYDNNDVAGLKVLLEECEQQLNRQAKQLKAKDDALKTLRDYILEWQKSGDTCIGTRQGYILAFIEKALKGE